MTSLCTLIKVTVYLIITGLKFLFFNDITTSIYMEFPVVRFLQATHPNHGPDWRISPYHVLPCVPSCVLFWTCYIGGYIPTTISADISPLGINLFLNLCTFFNMLYSIVLSKILHRKEEVCTLAITTSTCIFSMARCKVCGLDHPRLGEKTCKYQKHAIDKCKSLGVSKGEALSRWGYGSQWNGLRWKGPHKDRYGWTETKCWWFSSATQTISAIEHRC